MRVYFASVTNLFLFAIISFGFGIQQASIAVGQATKTAETVTDPSKAKDKPDCYGGFKGTIRVAGEIPEPRQIQIPESKADQIKDGVDLFDRSLLINEKQMLEGAFVLLFPRQNDLHPHPDLEDVPTEPVVMKIQNCTFLPNYFIVRRGQPLRVVNLDDVPYIPNLQSFSVSDSCNILPNSMEEYTYDHVDKLPCYYKCQLHPWMSAMVMVRDDPYSTTTDADGRFAIERIPVGRWKFQFWHVRGGYMEELKRHGESFLGRRGEFTIEIKGGETIDLGELLIDAKHLNDLK